jgi:hypothetical protein
MAAMSLNVSTMPYAICIIMLQIVYV